MQNLLGAARAVLADLAQLQVPTYATAVAGVVAPIVAAIVGVDITAAEIGGWATVVGVIAATVQKLTAKPAAPAKPADPPAPAK